MQEERQKAVKRLAARQTLRTAVQANRAMHSAGQAVQSTAELDQDTQTDYAESTVKAATQDAAATAGNVTLVTARLSYAKFRAIQAKRQQNAAAIEAAAESVAEPVEPSVEVSKEAAERTPLAPNERRKSVQRQQFQQQAVSERKISAKAQAEMIQPESDRRTATQQALKKQYITAQAVRQKLAEKENANALPRIAPKLPQVSKRAAVRENLRDTVRYALRKLRAALAKMGKAAAGTLLPFLGAGGEVLLLALVIGAAAAIIGSPMGILFADESSDPDSIPIREIVTEANTQFAEAINDLVAAHPECGETEFHYEYEDGHTWASYWPEVLAVYAVNANLNSDTDVVVLDRAHADKIIDTFWLMHQITSEVEEVELPPAEDETAEETDDGEIDDVTDEETDGAAADEANTPAAPQYKYILHITVTSRSVDELAADFRFTQDQSDILHELLSDEMRPTLVTLCGITVGTAGVPTDGSLQWPLPGYTTLSCQFGEADAFGRAGHRGIDIPAPAGTPILAAHDGTVLVAGWNDSYGNQVLLDSGAGLSTRYAHMTAFIVTPGQTVTAGQTLGYVGSTGDSTGNHLHFEVMLNGTLVDPLGVFSA